MNKVKKLFAIVFAITAVMLMQTYAFAYTGSGTSTGPYTVYTFDELKECCEKGGYVKLGGDIIEDSFKDINVVYDTHLDLDGKALKINNAASSFSNHFFTVKAYLEITGKGGEIYLKNYPSNVFEVEEGGELVINNCDITDEPNVSQHNWSDMLQTSVLQPICVSEGGKLTVNSGTITSLSENAVAVSNFGETTINGGTFKANADNSVSNWGEMYINGGTVENGMETVDSRLIVSGGKIYNLDCGGTKQKGVDIKLYAGTFIGSIHLTMLYNYGAENISAIIPETSTVKIDGKKLDRNSTFSTLYTESKNKTVEIISSKTFIKYISLTGDVTPICGNSPVYPVNESPALYDMTAHWYNYGGKVEITEFKPGRDYTLEIDLTVKDAYYMLGSFTSVDLRDTPDDKYSLDSITVTDTTIKVTYFFTVKPMITKQPYNPYDTNPMIGHNIYVDIDAENAESYEWHWYARGYDGVQQDFSDNNLLLTATGTTSPRLNLHIVSDRADGCSVYCVLKSGGYTLTSDVYSINIPQYTVSYSTRFKQSSQPSEKVYSGQTYTFPEYTSGDPSGYRFYKWYYSDSSGYYHYHAPGETMAYTLGKDITVSASYSKIFTISFDPNGGGGSMDTEEICQGDIFTFPRCKFTPPSNKEFDCWLAPIGDKETYDVGDTVIYPGEKNICLTARWKYKKYTVEFDTGEVCTPPPEQYVTYGEYATDNGDPVADGYNFMGWYYDSEYSQQFSFYNKITENTILYAKWEEIGNGVGFSYDYSGYDTENRKMLKVYYGDDLYFTTTMTAGTAFGYYMVVNGDTYSLTYSDGYHPFVIDDSTQVMRRIDGERIYYNAKSFIKPDNTVYIYSMRFVEGRRYFTSAYELDILYHPGDIDASGKVGDADAEMLLKHIVGIEALDSEQLERAELNNDGEIDILDVIGILKNKTA